MKPASTSFNQKFWFAAVAIDDETVSVSRLSSKLHISMRSTTRTALILPARKESYFRYFVYWKDGSGWWTEYFHPLSARSPLSTHPHPRFLFTLIKKRRSKQSDIRIRRQHLFLFTQVTNVTSSWCMNRKKKKNTLVTALMLSKHVLITKYESM